MADLINQISNDLQKQIESFEPKLSIADVGTVLEAGDGIARVSGLANVRSQELVQFTNGVMGIAFNLEKDAVGVIIMGDYDHVAVSFEILGKDNPAIVHGTDVGPLGGNNGDAIADGIGVELGMLVTAKLSDNLTPGRH